MKVFAVTVILVSLYLLYRIAYPNERKAEKGSDAPDRKQADEADAIVKKHYSYISRNLPTPTTATPTPTTATEEKTESSEKKQIIFVSDKEKVGAGVIPPEELNEVFSKSLEAMPMDYPLEEDEVEETSEPDVDLEEEAEELRQVLGKDAESAGGFTYEEIAQAIGAADNPQGDEEKIQKAGNVFYTLEKTDLFEQLISTDAGRAARINAVLERYAGSIILQAQETEDKEQDTEYRNFDITAFLS
ncbi:hypothetical protein EZS27_011349 [termite gut metagenome]|uniref:Uncharacterized protein n=1 Tax=termite gut metagenome TaxID=433724 RepID=A0A5J4S3W3_9ZZZZ